MPKNEDKKKKHSCAYAILSHTSLDVIKLGQVYFLQKGKKDGQKCS